MKNQTIKSIENNWPQRPQVLPELLTAVEAVMFLCLDQLEHNPKSAKRWQPEWLRQINSAVEPVMSFITGHLEMWISRITGRTYKDKTMIMIFILCLSVMRFVIENLIQ